MNVCVHRCTYIYFCAGGRAVEDNMEGKDFSSEGWMTFHQINLKEKCLSNEESSVSQS